MRVFIYRHAEAEAGEPDEGRKLTIKGREQAKRLGAWIPESEIEDVSEIWHSPLVRAYETAKVFKEQVSVLGDVDLYEVHELEPDADVEAMGCLLAECEGDVIVCGHNPFLEELVTALCAGEVGLGLVQLKKGAMLCLKLESEASEHLPMGLWAMQWFVTPRILNKKK